MSTSSTIDIRMKKKIGLPIVILLLLGVCVIVVMIVKGPRREHFYVSSHGRRPSMLGVPANDPMNPDYYHKLMEQSSIDPTSIDSWTPTSYKTSHATKYTIPKVTGQQIMPPGIEAVASMHMVPGTPEDSAFMTPVVGGDPRKLPTPASNMKNVYVKAM